MTSVQQSAMRPNERDPKFQSVTGNTNNRQCLHYFVFPSVTGDQFLDVAFIHKNISKLYCKLRTFSAIDQHLVNIYSAYVTGALCLPQIPIPMTYSAKCNTVSVTGAIRST